MINEINKARMTVFVPTLVIFAFSVLMAALF